MNILDNRDKKILYELDGNARLPLSILARKLRIGRDTLKYRITRLQKNGILKEFTAVINPYILGITIYKTYLRIENNKYQLNKLIEKLKNHPKVYWIGECEGRWDLIFSLYAKTPYEFDETQNEILSEFKEIILEFEIYILTEVFFYRKNYLNEKCKNCLFLGGNPKNEKIDRTDYKILTLLSRNARQNVVDIARITHTTPMIVSYRIKKLEKRKILQGYRINLDLSKVNMIFFKAQIYLKKYDAESIAKLREHCTSYANITSFIKQIGECKIELEIEVENYNRFNKIINEIRERMPDILHHIDSIVISNEHFKWMPEKLLD